MNKTFGQFRADSLVTHFSEDKDLPTIYCDMDGVVADFHGGLKKMESDLQKAGYNSVQDWLDSPLSDDKWKPIVKNRKFWSTLPMMPQALKLYNYIRPYNPNILSAVARRDPNCRPGKLAWLRKNLRMTDTSRINLVRRRDKKQYAKGNLLIDDLPKNIAEWKAAGGTGILHKSVGQTIAQLKKLGYK